MDTTKENEKQQEEDASDDSDGEAAEYYFGPNKVMRVPLTVPTDIVRNRLVEESALGRVFSVMSFGDRQSGTGDAAPNLVTRYFSELDRELAELGSLAKTALFLYLVFLACLLLYGDSFPALCSSQ